LAKSYEVWNEQKRIDFSTIPLLLEKSMEPLHGIWGLMGENRLKPDHPGSIGPGLGNLVVRHLPSSPLLCNELIEITMELQDNTGCEGHVGVVGMNCRERIAVAGNLLFGTIFRCSLVFNQFLYPLRWRFDPLDSI
jgi:hypothetical protein